MPNGIRQRKKLDLVLRTSKKIRRKKDAPSILFVRFIFSSTVDKCQECLSYNKYMVAISVLWRHQLTFLGASNRASVTAIIFQGQKNKLLGAIILVNLPSSDFDWNSETVD